MEQPTHLISQYSQAAPVLLAVDCIIFGVEGNQLKLLVFKREIEPYAGQWSLLGSFVNAGEGVHAAARRVLAELTGMQNVYMEQLHCFGQHDRDPGGRVVSVGHWSLIKVNQQRQEFRVAHHEAKWVPFNAVPELIMDHGQMVAMAIERLRERARFYPVGFELVPERFTLRQLKEVYEAIFDRTIDDRNFRKKLLKTDLLIQQEEKDMTTSKKGSFLYQFNHKSYQALSTKGYNFEF